MLGLATGVGAVLMTVAAWVASVAVVFGAEAVGSAMSFAGLALMLLLVEEVAMSVVHLVLTDEDAREVGSRPPAPLLEFSLSWPLWGVRVLQAGLAGLFVVGVGKGWWP
jgi:hypothetical protein